MKNLFRACSLLLVFLAGATGAFAQKTLLFKISGNGLTKPSYVFGTLHMVCTETYKLPAPVKAAIEKSDIVYTEVVIATMQEDAMKAMKYMMAPADSTLDKLLNEADYKNVGAFLNDTIGMPIDQLKALKPNAIATIGLQKMAPCAPFSSVDETVIKSFPKKNNKGLETLEYQLQLLMSAPMNTQAKILVETVKDWNKAKAELKGIMDAYVAGNLDLLNKLMKESETSEMLNQAELIDARNKNWVKEMPAIMKANSVFFAVGAGHLPGKMGVLALLKAKGYTVTPVALN
jgi:uncharacterized protein YbaP (TraB family)